MNSQGKNSIDVNLMIDRLKEEENVVNDADFAQKIGIKPSTLSMWRKRNSINLNRIFNYFEDYSKDWILHGIPPKFIDDKISPPEVKKPDEGYQRSKMVKKIRNLEIPADEKLDLLNTFINLLDEKRTKK